MVDILRTGTSALLAFQRSLATTGHNIANVNTPGYTRQRTELTASPTVREGGNYFGAGVDVLSVRRVYDDFLNAQVRIHGSANEQFSAYQKSVDQIDSLFASGGAGLGASLQRLFAAAHEVANTPTSLAARQVMLSEADNLATQLQSVNAQFDQVRRGLNDQVRGAVNEINALVEGIAKANLDIVKGQAIPGASPNDLLDKRDSLIAELSRHVSVQTAMQSDGSLNVFIGSGQALVVGGQFSQLAAVPSATNPQDVSIALQAQGATVDITSQMQGGATGGLLAFRRDVLDPARAGIGLIAVGLADAFNQIHTAGFDLDGNPGGAFFSVGAPKVIDNSANTGSAAVTASYADASQLTGADYEITNTGTGFTVRRTSDGQLTALPGAGSYTIDGLDITIGAGSASGDRYVVQGTREALLGFAALITNPREVAAAQAPAVGDNRNALALAQLENKLTLLGGTASFGEAYGRIVSDVGTRARQNQVAGQAQQALYDQAVSAREAHSGVNLDEEAADLIRYQQAYEAAAQIIRVTDGLFRTLLDSFR